MRYRRPRDRLPISNAINATVPLPRRRYDASPSPRYSESSRSSLARSASPIRSAFDFVRCKDKFKGSRLKERSTNKRRRALLFRFFSFFVVTGKSAEMSRGARRPWDLSRARSSLPRSCPRADDSVPLSTCPLVRETYFAPSLFLRLPPCPSVPLTRARCLDPKVF